MAADLLELQELLDKAAAGLPKMTSRKMFGCYALWADENVFGLDLEARAHWRETTDGSSV